MAKGVATKAESTVTIKEPANIGKAPTAGFPSGPIAPGSQCVPKRKRNGFTPSTKKVERPNYVKVRAFNEKGEQFVLEGEELLARAILHENDHLDGILYIDHVK